MRAPATFRARICFYPTEIGGRTTVATAEFLTPLFRIHDEFWSGRIWIEDVRPIHPGATVEADVTMLSPEIAPLLHENDTFDLYEARKVGEGTILKLYERGNAA